MTVPVLAAHGSPSHSRTPVDVFAAVPYPGHPEGIAVERDGTVYVGTHQAIDGGPHSPSRVFAYDRHGRLKHTYVIRGQAPQGQGLVGMALDGEGLLYLLDRNPARVVTLDPRTGRQRSYATFADVPPCAAGRPVTNCSATSGDRPAFADDLAFAPNGTLYVTDIEQGLIWRIPPGGGAAEVWFTDPRLESVFGPNGIRFVDHGRTLMFAQSLHNVSDPEDIFEGTGRIYTLPIQPDGGPGRLGLFWEGDEPGEGIDGFAIGRSGRVYAALALPNHNSLLVLDKHGREIERISTDESASHPSCQPADIPFDAPASVAFTPGHSILVTNQAYFGGPPENQVVLRAQVGEPALPLFRP
ncbi:SMP-30/gluconolactonase/LRE family protein [Streptomyces sp. MP131-18]|uniref:SMP-30/gluconolactonase/LRE family protein n=1 Tax=Streptomyces sp. MP131-18 TaxID=1857892 RepID=UPI0015C53575|nr:SMP-30/gluconolactonase/LRE family protein [Streptomyces sp. MP131-18]